MSSKQIFLITTK